ncbi:MAG: hypothetical protein LJE92_06340 [Gammaproteobacteria bacterium]|nr:hypothetical protein [Gammaproteobacteria bacterium]
MFKNYARNPPRLGLSAIREATLIVLSADHGQPELPGRLHERGIHDAHYFDPKSAR